MSEPGLYIIEFSPPPRGGGKPKEEKREKKEIWEKYNFLQYQIIKLN